MRTDSLAVMTLTYNRAYILGQLHESLLAQTDLGFVWLIVDDGSTDNTRELVQSWIQEHKIIIHYIYQENGGKHRAHNTGVNNSTQDLIMICDSDDYLIPNAVEKVKAKWRECCQDNNIAGIIGYKGQIIGDRVVPSKGMDFPDGITYTTVTSLFKNRVISETTQIYRTDVLKKHLFPEIEGEKFFPEIWCWREIDKDYKISILREILEIYEYLPDGYTRNSGGG